MHHIEAEALLPASMHFQRGASATPIGFGGDGHGGGLDGGVGI